MKKGSTISIGRFKTDPALGKYGATGEHAYRCEITPILRRAMDRFVKADRGNLKKLEHEIYADKNGWQNTSVKMKIESGKTIEVNSLWRSRFLLNPFIREESSRITIEYIQKNAKMV